MTFDDVQWLPICLGLTALGVVLTWTVGRRRGAAAVMRGLAWSLLPIAAYMTGTIEALWDMGAALTDWVTGFVFNVRTWAGVAVAGLALLLFLISGFLRGRTAARGPAKPKPAAAGGSRVPTVGNQPARKQVTPPQRQPAVKDDDDFSEIEEILRRRGIS